MGHVRIITFINRSQTSVLTPSKECPVTPIRAAMNSIQELNKTLSTSQEEPCSELKSYFEVSLLTFSVISV